jgi:hypothetical protein
MAQAAVNRAREATLRLARILDKNRPVATRVWTPALATAGVFSIVCLMALAHAPQIVAFDRNSVGSQSERAYSAPVENVSVQPAMHSAAVIPASLHVSDTVAPSAARAELSHGKRTRATKGSPVSRANVAVARMNRNELLPRVVPVSANADEDMTPEFQTVVFIEATQFISSDASVWRVQVWRVMLVAPRSERIGIVPVAHSI